MGTKSSTLFTVGTLLRHAEDAGAPVRVLVQGTWLDGRVVGADGMGVVLDDAGGQQVLVRLDSIVAVSFSRTDIDDPDPAEDAHPQGGRRRDPIAAGPVGSGPVHTGRPKSAHSIKVRRSAAGCSAHPRIRGGDPAYVQRHQHSSWGGTR